MILQWMGYCLGIATLAALCAATLERVLQLRGCASRGAWAAAIVGSLALPGAAWLDPPVVPAPDRVPTGAPSAQYALTPVVRWAAPVGLRSALARGDGLLGPLWLASSAVMLLLLLCSAGSVTLRRRTWGAARLDGVPVRVSTRTGPAVVGFRRMEIVVPEWTLGLPPGMRTLVVAHEREHLRAGCGWPWRRIATRGCSAPAATCASTVCCSWKSDGAARGSPCRLPPCRNPPRFSNKGFGS